MTTNRLEIVAEDLLDELALVDGLDLDSEIVTRARDEYYRLIDYLPEPDHLAALMAARAVWTTPQDATP